MRGKAESGKAESGNTPEARALADDVERLAKLLDGLTVRAGELPPHIPGQPSHPAHPAYYALNRAWRELSAACDHLMGQEPKR